jgi:hypothetical protein
VGDVEMGEIGVGTERAEGAEREGGKKGRLEGGKRVKVCVRERECVCAFVVRRG